jgi:hypothetical protein
VTSLSRGAIRQSVVPERATAWRPDLLAGAGVIAVAVALSWPLLTAQDLRTGAGDWPAHAFRVRELLANGLASWSHTWAGGMPLWEGYQAAPHIMTAALVRATGLPIEQTMVVLAGVLLVVLRFGVYVAARSMGAPALAAAVGALLVAALDSAWQPVANYSELWGLALAPYLLAAAYRWAGRPAGFAIAALVGLSVEVHPLLAVLGGFAFGAAFLASPGGRSTVMLGAQAAVAAAAAAVFWLPVVTSARPAYLEPYFTSTRFARLLVRLTTDGFLVGWPIVAAATLAAGAIALRGRTATHAARFLLVVGAAVGAAIVLSLTPATPDVVREAQLARLAGVAPLLLGLLVAVAAGDVSRGRRQPVVLGVALVLAAAACMRIPASPAAPHDGEAEAPDAVTLAFTGGLNLPGGRVYADAVTTARASRWADDRLRFAGSYSGREWSILHGPLQFFLAGNGTAENRAAYLVALGVEYVLVRHGERPPLVHPLTGEPLDWQVAWSSGDADLLRPPWPVTPAWLLPAARRHGLTAPDLPFRDVADAYVRDVITRRVAALALAPDTPPAEISYPDGETIVVQVEGLDGDSYLVVDENWDTAWRAETGSRRLHVERLGLNQLGVDLTGMTGGATIRLTHHHRREAQIGLMVSLLALPLGAIFALATVRRARRETRRVT